MKFHEIWWKVLKSMKSAEKYWKVRKVLESTEKCEKLWKVWFCELLWWKDAFRVDRHDFTCRSTWVSCRSTWFRMSIDMFHVSIDMILHVDRHGKIWQSCRLTLESWNWNHVTGRKIRNRHRIMIKVNFVVIVCCYLCFVFWVFHEGWANTKQQIFATFCTIGFLQNDVFWKLRNFL